MGKGRSARPPRWRALGERAAARRLELGLTQEELARRAGYSQGAIALIEAGRSCPSREGLARLANALYVPVDELAQLAGYLPPRDTVAVYLPPEVATDVQRFAALPAPVRKFLLRVFPDVERLLVELLADQRARNRSDE